jgi:peptide deformylase
MMKGQKTHEIIMINPRILSKSEKTVFSEESCLSIPDYTAYTRRSNRVSIVYTDVEGRERKRDFTDYNACVIQHEIDHLHGILFTDALVV